MFQSAPGTRAGRCHKFFDAIISILPVSIRARHACRAMLKAGKNCTSPILVSIRARHACRAMPVEGCGRHLDSKFQSAPGTRAGRCPANVVTSIEVSGFNPRPARVPGDAIVHVPYALLWRVSIRARHACRAMPDSLSSIPFAMSVSIRARHACRAMPGKGRCRESFGGVSIRARHACRAMHPITKNQSARHSFQSAPGTRAGRCEDRPGQFPHSAGFNPRPARVPGDASSIGLLRSTVLEFQSAPGTRAGRCLVTRSTSKEIEMFQSAPGTRAGRCRSSLRRQPAFLEFQSAPGTRAGRCLTEAHAARPT